MIKSKFTEAELEEIQKQIDTESGLYDYMSKDYPFEVIEAKFGEQDDESATLYVPEYQREFVWDPKKQSRFIESVLLGVPLTPFLVSEDENKRLEIIDGSQRIRTLIAFHEDKLRLRGLEKLDKINGAKFKDLPKKAQNYFKNRDFKIIITDESEKEIKQDIFNRINTSSEKLTDSEIRKGAYSGNFYTMILTLKDNQAFKSICPVSDIKENRGEYEELILRFFAYSDKYLDFKHDVANFLNDYLDEMNEKQFDEAIYLKSFNDMVTFITNNFLIGFRKEAGSNSTPRVRFEAISVGVHLALQENPSLIKPNMDWLESNGFKIQTTSDASNNPNRLKNRIEFVRDGLLGRLTPDRLANG
ncbi:DUF262 domain-containing protein [Aliarcobacter skirrowii]|uniref:DUF262 domain-containing protein n=1 Tax=Aliarcobacter skirrowii TaxID=28200 RepID=UPI0029B82C01|nr:DUF262 domain-containing protein [Aliarcobacter skirrowii]MDX4061711.1 DUF262 domain-containing protein [Aliarcobacter skirrowii]